MPHLSELSRSCPSYASRPSRPSRPSRQRRGLAPTRWTSSASRTGSTRPATRRRPPASGGVPLQRESGGEEGERGRDGGRDGGRERDRKTDRQTDRQSDRQSVRGGGRGRQIDRQTDSRCARVREARTCGRPPPPGARVVCAWVSARVFFCCYGCVRARSQTHRPVSLALFDPPLPLPPRPPVSTRPRALLASPPRRRAAAPPRRRGAGTWWRTCG